MAPSSTPAELFRRDARAFHVAAVEVGDVVPRQRNGGAVLRELQLEHDEKSGGYIAKSLAGEE